MKKDTYYFSHDANAKDDPKCMMLIDELGMEGYGIFWVLIETLRNQPDYKCPVTMIKSLAKRYNTSEPKVEVVINNYGLFVIENGLFFFSESLNRRMEVADKKRFKLSISGKKGNEVRWGKLSPPDSEAIATQSLLKESKVKEIKININTPELQDFLSYAQSKVPQEYPQLINSLKLKYEAWREAGWRDGNGKPIKNWKSTLLNTIPYLKRDEPKAPKPIYERLDK